MLSYDVDIKARRRLRLVLSKMRPEKKQKRSSSAISNIFPLGQVARQCAKQGTNEFYRVAVSEFSTHCQGKNGRKMGSMMRNGNVAGVEE